MKETQLQKLSARESEVLKHLVKGKLNKEIANDLGVTTDAVKKHLRNIYIKLGVRNRVEAVMEVLPEKRIYAS